jgi:hypothetical protein
MTRGARIAVLAAMLAPSLAFAADERRVVDAIAVRFYAPETGGASRPLFVTERVLAFEARVEALTESFADGKLPYLERHARAALEHHVAEEMLARLPLERAPMPAELEKMIVDIVQSLVTRAGGRDALTRAADAEGIAQVEVDAMLRRQARAAIYIDRAISPILKPSEEQLREVYRTAAHPYRALSFSEARANLERWYVAERIRVAESSYLQTARTRVKIIAVAR